MNKISKIATATALVVASAGASAWWGPMTTFSDEFFGNGDGVGNGDFNMAMNANANSQAFTRGYGYNRYYHAPYYYGYPVAPVAPAAPAADVK